MILGLFCLRNEMSTHTYFILFFAIFVTSSGMLVKTLCHLLIYPDKWCQELTLSSSFVSHLKEQRDIPSGARNSASSQRGVS